MVVRRRIPRCLLLLLLVASTCNIGRSQVGPEQVVFPSNRLQLQGFLWKPTGTGPFPAILWNHGSEKYPGAERVSQVLHGAFLRLLRASSQRTGAFTWALYPGFAGANSSGGAGAAHDRTPGRGGCRRDRRSRFSEVTGFC